MKTCTVSHQVVQHLKLIIFLNVSTSAPRPPGASGQSEDQLRRWEAGEDQLGRPTAQHLPSDCIDGLEATQMDKDDD